MHQSMFIEQNRAILKNQIEEVLKEEAVVPVETQAANQSAEENKNASLVADVDSVVPSVDD